MTVQVRAKECIRRSAVESSRSELTSRSAISICSLSISLSLSFEVGRDEARNMYEDGNVKFSVQQTSDRFGQRLIEFPHDSKIAVLRVGLITLRPAAVKCKIKE